MFGLAGSLKVVRGPSGHGVLTFHLPFIVAAMVLGGPIAGGWVAFIASFERRELREAPWYGILANHAGLALAAILGGLAAQAAVAAASALELPGGLAITLVGAAVGTLVLTVAQTALAAGVIVLRDGLTLRETLHVFDRSFRGTLLAETVLGWVFVVTWVAVGWWAPALCAVLVLALWRTNAAEAERDRDELTGLLTARAFATRVAEAALRGRRGIEGAAYVFLDLDGFKQVNDGPRSHAVGDEVLAALGERLRRSIRVTDAAGRRGGDEFMVLFVGVRDEATAVSLAERVHALVTAPYVTDGRAEAGRRVGRRRADRARRARLRAGPPPARRRRDVRGQGGGRRRARVAAGSRRRGAAARAPTARRGRPRRLAGDQRPRRPGDHRDVRERAHEARRDRERGDQRTPRAGAARRRPRRSPRRAPRAPPWPRPSRTRSPPAASAATNGLASARIPWSRTIRTNVSASAPWALPTASSIPAAACGVRGWRRMPQA